MKKIFNVVAVFAAVVAMASCCGGGKCDSNAAADTAKCCADSAAQVVCDSAAAAGDSAAAEAQKEFNANDMFAKRMARYTAELGLDDAQQAKLAEVLTASAEQIEKHIAESVKPTIEEIKAFRVAESDEVKKILNEDQFAKFQKFEEERTKQFEERIAKKAAEAAAKAAEAAK